MADIKKITICLLAITVPVSLIAGYFCLAMPEMAQAEQAQAMNDMSGCNNMAQGDYFSTPKANDGSIALCCVTKRENSDSGFLALNDWTPGETSQQNGPIEAIEMDNFYPLTLYSYPVSPPPAELLASVIKIE